MKIKKTSKIMALALAVVVAFVPAMMVSAATINQTGATLAAGTIPAGATTVQFTVTYTLTSADAGDQITTLVTKGSDTITYSDPPANTLPTNISYIDQVTYDAQVNTFTFSVDVPAVTTNYYVKVGGTGITDPADGSTVLTITPAGWKVYGYVNVPVAVGATVAIGTATATTDATGKFEITGISDGTHNLTISANSALTRTIPVTVSGADYEVSTSTNPVSLMFGDTDTDNDVDMVDLGNVKDQFNKVSTDIGYNIGFDFDRDGDIDMADLGNTKDNFNKISTDYPVWSK